MAYIVAHEQELIDSAYVLIKEKSHADDMKSEADLHVLDTILSGVQTNFNFDTYNSLTPNWYYKVLR